MKCIEIRQNKLALVDREKPKPKKGEVLIKVHAAGVNRPDILQRKGLYPAPEGVTDIPGLEIAGEIIELGRAISEQRTGLKPLKKKDRVMALVSGGGYAEYCVAPAAQCLHIPKGMDDTTAAGIPETFFTVWSNLFDIGNLKNGETILIHGGGSGIGTTAIQMAKSIGAKVFVTAGTDFKCKQCKKLGADMAVNYKNYDFVEKILKETKNKGVDVVLDMVGGDYVPRNMKILNTGGRNISIAVQRGQKTEVDILEVMSKRLILTGSTLRPRSWEEKSEITKALYKNILPLMHKKGAFMSLFSKKRISPVIDKIFLLSEAQAAHNYLDSDVHFGKAILRVI